MKNNKHILAFERPDLLKEWNFEKNALICAPDEITVGSSKKVWWICSENHSFQAQIYKRTRRGDRCPYCSGKKVLAGFNDVATTNPQLVKEWAKDNEISPKDVTKGSHQNVKWICQKCGHAWTTQVKARAVSNHGCPKCKGKNQIILNRKRVVKQGINDLETLHPYLLAEWDYQKNSILPSEVTPNSNIKVHWICSKCSYSWQAIIQNRALKQTGCPVCSGSRVVYGINDLETENPSYLKEWNYEKNIISPSECSSGSNKKVWWICSKGHTWKASIKSRRNGSGCPVCANILIVPGINDFATKFPKLAKEWSTKNKIKPNTISYGSNKIVWWTCQVCGSEFKMSVSSRSSGQGCSNCAKVYKTSLPEQIIFYYVKQCFKDAVHSYKPTWLSNRSEIDIYIPSLKIGIEYDGKAWHKDIKKDKKKDKLACDNGITVIRIREYGCPNYYSNSIKIKTPKPDKDYTYMIKPLEYLFAKISSLTGYTPNISFNISEDLDSIYYSFTRDRKSKSLKKANPLYLKDWDYNKNNPLLPEMFTKRSTKKVWWKCTTCNHSWRASPNQRQQNPKCPVCSYKVLSEGINDISTVYPNLAKEWSKKNSLPASKVIATKKHKHWWKCTKCGYEWLTNIQSRLRGNGCPVCAGHVVIAGINDLYTSNPKVCKEWDYEKNKDIAPTEITPNSHKKAWWICSACGHNWKADVASRNRGSGCPNCKYSKMRKI